MPRYSYTDFTVDSDDMNVPGSSDVTKPSEGWKGRDVNDSVRATNSAVRNLGDVAAKLPANADGSPNNGPNNGRIGTAAFQDVNSFDNVVLGPNVRGSIGANILIMGVCAVSDIAALYAEQRTRGFDLCDGRLTVNPYSPFNQIRMPNFMGLFPWFAPTLSEVLQIRFNFDSDGNPVVPPAGDNTSDYQNRLALTGQRRIAVADHTHGTPAVPGGQGQVGGTSLAYNQLPQVVTNVQTQAGSGAENSGGNRDLLLTFNNNESFGGSHTHLVGFGGGFDTGNFDIRPPAIAVLPFLRVW